MTIRQHFQNHKIKTHQKYRNTHTHVIQALRCIKRKFKWPALQLTNTEGFSAITHTHSVNECE